jgi:hypothetical protein
MKGILRLLIFYLVLLMAGPILASTLFLLTLLVTSAQAATTSVICPSDPYVDPRNDPCNALGYIANNALTAIAFGEWPLSYGNT